MLKINRLILLSGTRTIAHSLREEPVNTIVGGVIAVLMVGGLFFGEQTAWGYSGITLGIITILYSLHSWRKDKVLRATLFSDWRKIVIVQYQVPLLPVNVKLIATGYWWLASILVTGGVLIALSSPKLSGRFMAIERLVSKLPRAGFEWRSAFRAKWAGILILNLIGLGAIAFDGLLDNNVLTLAPVAAILLIAFTCSESLTYGESRLMIEAFQQKPSRFLKRKIVSTIKLLSLAIAPVSIVSLIAFGDITIVASVLIAYLIVVTATLIKYSYYREGREPKLQLVIISMIALVLAPLLPVLLWILWRKADQRLTPYLHAFS